MDLEAGDVSARLEPEVGSRPFHGRSAGVARCGAIAGGRVAVAVLLCLTTTTALVAVQQMQLRAVESKLDGLARRIPDIPSLMSTLQGDVLGVQALVSGGTTQAMLEAEMQGARMEQLVEAFTMLVGVLQRYFSSI